MACLFTAPTVSRPEMSTIFPFTTINIFYTLQQELWCLYLKGFKKRDKGMSRKPFWFTTQVTNKVTILELVAIDSVHTDFLNMNQSKEPVNLTDQGTFSNLGKDPPFGRCR